MKRDRGRRNLAMGVTLWLILAPLLKLESWGLKAIDFGSAGTGREVQFTGGNHTLPRGTLQAWNAPPTPHGPTAGRLRKFCSDPTPRGNEGGSILAHPGVGCPQGAFPPISTGEDANTRHCRELGAEVLSLRFPSLSSDCSNPPQGGSQGGLAPPRDCRQANPGWPGWPRHPGFPRDAPSDGRTSARRRKTPRMARVAPAPRFPRVTEIGGKDSPLR